MASDMLSQGLNEVKGAITGVRSGDEKIHQQQAVMKDAFDKDASITSDWGAKSSNTDDWLKAVTEDQHGPLLLEDPFGREKIHRFDHERIPERVVHARGTAAFGHFKVYESAADVTLAPVFTDTSRKTPVFIRFSTVLGSRGSADTVRDARGFAVKFYTQEGNFDIVGNDIPVFFIQDAMKFPDLVHAAKPEPHNEVPQAQSAHNNFWDFQYLHTEATHMFMWTNSDRGIPRSYRMMQGFGVNTYILVNERGERHFVKFHFTPELGVHSLVWDEALKLAGQDPDFHRKDLWEAIDKGLYPKWKFGIQVLEESREHEFDFDILDATKVWPEDQVPVRYIGELELNRNVDEYFAQTEQVAFCTSHIVPGIGFSDDPLLQGRNFSYQDTQISRLGVNWEELPINRPICPVMNHNRDGRMRHTITKGTVNYWPNRYSAIPPTEPNKGGYVDFPAKVVGLKQRMRSEKFREHISQAQLFYNSLAKHEKVHLSAALAFELDHCEDPTVYTRMSERLADIDLSLAQSVATMVGGPIPQAAGRANHGRRAKGLSQMDFTPKDATIKSRRVAIIIADGFDAAAYNGVKLALTALQALPFTIGPRRSVIKPKDDFEAIMPDHHLEGMRSTMFDAIFVPGGAQSVKTLRESGRAVHWLREAFGHLKTIGATGEAVKLVADACHVPGVTISSGSTVESSYGVITAAHVDGDSYELTKSQPIKITTESARFIDLFTCSISQHRNWDRELDGLSILVAY